VKAHQPAQAATPAGVVMLAEWRAADAVKRQELAARKFPAFIYNPTKGDDVCRDVLRVSCGLHTVFRGLKVGTLPPDTAAAVLHLMHDDLEALAREAEALERKLRKAKKKAKR
jgi:hypothetical protein